MKKLSKRTSKIGIGVGLLLLVLISGCVSSDKGTTSAPDPNATDVPATDVPATDVPAEGKQVEAPDPSRGVFNYVTWEYYVADQIDEYTKADPGKHYYVVTVHFNNTGTETYTTNTNNWELTADGVTYTYDVATFSMSDYKDVDVGPGGKTDAQYVFLVDGEPKEIFLNYEQW